MGVWDDLWNYVAGSAPATTPGPEGGPGAVADSEPVCTAPNAADPGPTSTAAGPTWNPNGGVDWGSDPTQVSVDNPDHDPTGLNDDGFEIAEDGAFRDLAAKVANGEM